MKKLNIDDAMYVLEIIAKDGYSFLWDFIEDFEVVKQDVQDELVLTLKYGERKERVISGLRCISKPGLRVYAKSDNIPRVLNGLGIAIISTSKGVMTDKKARKENIGGEVLAYIW